jgi:hypothetical protein
MQAVHHRVLFDLLAAVRHFEDGIKEDQILGSQRAHRHGKKWGGMWHALWHVCCLFLDIPGPFLTTSWKPQSHTTPKNNPPTFRRRWAGRGSGST